MNKSDMINRLKIIKKEINDISIDEEWVDIHRLRALQKEREKLERNMEYFTTNWKDD